MTSLGIYLSKRSVNKAEISRRTGINKSRMTLLTNNTATKLTVEEMYLIALAIEANPSEVLLAVCKNITLPSPSSTEGK